MRGEPGLCHRGAAVETGRLVCEADADAPGRRPAMHPRQPMGGRVEVRPHTPGPEQTVVRFTGPLATGADQPGDPAAHGLGPKARCGGGKEPAARAGGRVSWRGAGAATQRSRQDAAFFRPARSGRQIAHGGAAPGERPGGGRQASAAPCAREARRVSAMRRAKAAMKIAVRIRITVGAGALSRKKLA